MSDRIKIKIICLIYDDVKDNGEYKVKWCRLNAPDVVYEDTVEITDSYYDMGSHSGAWMEAILKVISANV